MLHEDVELSDSGEIILFADEYHTFPMRKYPDFRWSVWRENLAHPSASVPPEMKGSPFSIGHLYTFRFFISRLTFSSLAGSQYSAKFLSCGKNEIAG
jgi:hypothetical protein